MTAGIDRATRATQVVTEAERVDRLRVDALVRRLASPEIAPISDYEAAVAARLVDGLSRWVAERLCALLSAMSPSLTVAESAHPRADAGLIGIALARAAEHRLTLGLRAVRDRDQADRPASGEGAALELALMVADSRRTDSRGDPLLIAADVPAHALSRLVWRQAAALRAAALDGGGEPGPIDIALANAGASVLADHDAESGAAAAATRLAHHLLAEAADATMLIDAALARARPGLAAALIAVSTGADQPTVLAAFGHPDRTAILLRAADLPRADAVAILLRLTEACAVDDETLIAAVDAYDATSVAEARAAVDWLRLDPGYRAAILAAERA